VGNAEAVRGREGLKTSQGLLAGKVKRSEGLLCERSGRKTVRSIIESQRKEKGQNEQ